MDWEFGQCLGLLKKHNLSENTVVIFTSEQGNSFPFAKWTCYGNGLQTAFLMRWPGKIKEGSKTDAMIEYVDVVPTLTEISGLNVPKNIDGVSFLSVLTEGKNKHKEYVYGIQTTRGIKEGSDHYGIRTVRSESFRYIYNLTPEAKFQTNMTSDNEKNYVFNSWREKAAVDRNANNLVYKYEFRPQEELYDVVNDPFEMHNIANDPKYAEVIKELKNKLFQWMNEQGDKGQQTEMEALEHTMGGSDK
jgi:N-sulfoglucosamine sulfohydrolase